MTDPYELLAAFARWQDELIAEGRLDELDELGSHWERLVADLPETPPESARDAFETAERTLVTGIAQLELRLEEVRRELSILRTGRTTMTAYGLGSRSTVVDAQG